MSVDEARPRHGINVIVPPVSPFVDGMACASGDKAIRGQETVLKVSRIVIDY